MMKETTETSLQAFLTTRDLRGLGVEGVQIKERLDVLRIRKCRVEDGEDAGGEDHGEYGGEEVDDDLGAEWRIAQSGRHCVRVVVGRTKSGRRGVGVGGHGGSNKVNTTVNRREDMFEPSESNAVDRYAGKFSGLEAAQKFERMATRPKSTGGDGLQKLVWRRG